MVEQPKISTGRQPLLRFNLVNSNTNYRATSIDSSIHRALLPRVMASLSRKQSLRRCEYEDFTDQTHGLEITDKTFCTQEIMDIVVQKLKVVALGAAHVCCSALVVRSCWLSLFTVQMCYT